MDLPLGRDTSCEVWSVICFLRARGEGMADIHRQISAVYGVIMSVQIVRHTPHAGRPTDAVNKNSTSAVRALLE